LYFLLMYGIELNRSKVVLDTV